MDSTQAETLAIGRESVQLALGVLTSLLLFLVAIQLLGAATAAAGPPLERVMGQYVAGDGQALGASWLATYVLTNGSVIAALAVSLFNAGLLTDGQLYLMLTGTRLGGAAIVVFIGLLDYFQKRRFSFSESTRLGILTFVLTHSIFLPTTVLGYLLLPRLQSALEPLSTRMELPGHPLAVIEPVVEAIVDTADVGPAFLLALLGLVGSLTIFDRVLKQIDTEWLRTRFFSRFQDRWTAFGLGILITGATTSVAFSLGVVVPLYNRGYIKRREMVPYVLGANIGTFFDTILVAVVLESPAGVAIVLAVVGIGTAITVGTLLRFETYLQAVETTQDHLLENRRTLTWFVAGLVALPLVLVLIPW